MTTRLQNALDVFSELPQEEKDLFLELSKKRYIEDRRQEIKRNAEETLTAVKEQKARYGNINDLIADLEG